MEKGARHVAVTGAAGQIAYSLIFRIAAGELFGRDQPIVLHLLETAEGLRSMEGVVMELDDCAFPLLKKVHSGSDPHQIFRDVEYAFLVGAKPRGPGMERRDLLFENAKIFTQQGEALDHVASDKLLTLVVGNPCNTNCLIALHKARRLARRHFFSMMRLDHNRALSLLANRAGTSIEEVHGLTVWGNHSLTQVPDFTHITIGKETIQRAIPDRRWLEETFISTVQNRGATVIAARGKSSAASAAQAALGAMHNLIFPTPKGEWFSMGCLSDENPYGIEPGLVFSFPCTSEGDGRIRIKEELLPDPFIEERIRLSEKELKEERAMIAHLLK